MNRILCHVTLSLCAMLAFATPGAAQEIPPYVPANPVLASRSALYAQPFIPFGTRPGWHMRAVLDYYNAVEVSHSFDARQTIFDAEVLEADLWVRRTLGTRFFILADLPIRGGYSGFLDGLLIAYHHATGLSVPARDELPRNRFLWEAALPDTTIMRPRPGTFVGDLRVGGGMRFGHAELIGTMTLPTATFDGDGWSRHTIGTSLALLGRVIDHDRFTVAIGGSLGYTPPRGALAKYQRSIFASASLSGRWRFAGQQAVFGTIWSQSPSWHDTGLGSLDEGEFTTDFGFLIRLAPGWPELQLGMTQDLRPHGPAMDVGFTFGARW